MLSRPYSGPIATRRDDGYTLTEILVVILILAVLAAAVVIDVSTMTGDSAKASCEFDVRMVDHAVQAYSIQMGRNPTSISDMESSATDSDGTTVGPWLHNTPTNDAHYSVIVTDGSTAYTRNDDGTTFFWTDNSSATPHVPPQGIVLVETWDAPSKSYLPSILYQTPVLSSDAASSLGATGTVDACANVS